MDGPYNRVTPCRGVHASAHPWGNSRREGPEPATGAPPPPKTLPGNTPTNNRVEPRSTPRGRHQGQRSTKGKGGGAQEGREIVSCAMCRAT